MKLHIRKLEQIPLILRSSFGKLALFQGRERGSSPTPSLGPKYTRELLFATHSWRSEAIREPLVRITASVRLASKRSPVPNGAREVVRCATWQARRHRRASPPLQHASRILISAKEDFRMLRSL